MDNEKDLGKAIRGGNNEIVIEGDLARKVIKIKAVGSVSWGVCFGAIGVIVVGIIATIASGGAAAPAEIPALVAASPVLVPTVAILGMDTTITAVMIAVAAGGVGALTRLRKYKIKKISDNYLILTKK